MERTITTVSAVLGVLAAFALPLTAHAADSPRSITVFAAPWVQSVLKDIGSLLVKAGGLPVTFNFAISPVLARQIEDGAAADIFIPADEGSMNGVEKRGLLQIGTRSDFVTNRLALMAVKDSTIRLKIAPWFPLLQALGGEKLAMADGAIPLGVYGEDTVRQMHVWTQVQGQVTRADNARIAVTVVAQGEAPLGIVYDTEALAEPRVRIVDLFPEASHPASVYPAAMLKNAAPGAVAFLRVLGAPDAHAIFLRYGFRRP